MLDTKVVNKHKRLVNIVLLTLRHKYTDYTLTP